MPGMAGCRRLCQAECEVSAVDRGRRWERTRLCLLHGTVGWRSDNTAAHACVRTYDGHAAQRSARAADEAGVTAAD